MVTIDEQTIIITDMSQLNETHLKEVNRLMAVAHSAGIEGSDLSFEDTFALIKYGYLNSQKSLHDVNMVQDHYRALVYVLELAQEKAPITKDILGKEVKSRLSAEDMQHIRALTHVGNNLNQIVKGLQRSNFAMTEKDFMKTRTIVKKLSRIIKTNECSKNS